MAAFQSLELRQISKSFQGHPANQNVDFSVKSGEIVGLLGENGAGKTTLMNILFGMVKPDAGQILLNGEIVSFPSPREAIEAGIGMVHQHFMLVQNHSVAENLVLGYEKAPKIFPQKFLRKKIRELGERFNLNVDPDAQVWSLSAGEQQMVEIVKALLYGAEVLILDEPTSVLTPQEAEHLFKVLRQMAAEGKAVVLISHKLDEIMSLCHRAVILRKGKNSGQASIAGVKKETLAQMMVGKDVTFNLSRKNLVPGETVLEVENLRVMGDRGLAAVKGVSFKVRKNEILGIAGVSGNGQRELVEAITGLRGILGGRVFLKGEDISGVSAKVAAQMGIAHVPEERIKFGIVPNLLIYENSILKSHHSGPFSKVFLLDYDHIKGHAENILDGYQVAAPSIHSTMKNLSGGNIQKLIIGREIENNPELLVASHPTYGLDVGATQYIREQLLKRREEGGAVLLVSEDLEELFEVCDRIAVIFQGQFMGILPATEAKIEDVGMMMAGSMKKESELC